MSDHLMEVLAGELPLELDVDLVLRGQGADPASLRARRPGLVQTAEKALQLGRGLLSPLVLHKTLDVESFRHQRLVLEGGFYLEGKLIAEQIASASRVVVVVVTIGERLEKHISELYPNDPSLALALDGLGTAAVETLAVAACRHFGEQVEATGLHTSLPFSPGGEDWPLERGQQQIFRILQPDPALIRLMPSYQMVPRKSTSLVLGVGAAFDNTGSTCDFCSMKATCRYQHIRQ
jgi:hypothetical protein